MALLDLRTLFLSACLFNAAMGILQLLVWMLQRTHRALALWGLSNIVFGLGSLLIGCRDYVPQFVSVGLGNGAVIFGALIFWSGIREFSHQKPVHALVVLLPAAVCLGYVYLPYVRDDLFIRICLQETFGAAVNGLIIRDCVRAQRIEYLKIRQVLIWTNCLIIASAAVRIIDSRPGLQSASLWASGGIQGWLFLAAIFLVAAQNVCVLMMNEQRLQNRLRQLAYHDPLTDTLNRSGFNSALRKLAPAKAARGLRLFTLLMDLDRFKQINDRYGHEAGDQTIVSFAEAARRRLEDRGLLSRHGGEEFCALVWVSNLAEAINLANAVRLDFAQQHTEADGQTVATTVSIGVAEWFHAAEAVGRAIARADQALYAAKAQGRNRVCAESAEAAQGGPMAAA